MGKPALLATMAAFVGLSAIAQAAPITIIAFAQDSTTNTITASSIADTSTTLTGTNVAITVSGYGDGTPTPFAAFLNLNANGSGAATLMGGAGTNYLSGSFSDIALAGSRVSGPQGGFQASLLATEPPGTVNFTSDQIPASNQQGPSTIGFTFTALSQAPDMCGSTNCHFTASVSGNASAPRVAVSAPSGLALGGLAAVRREVAA